MSTLHREFGSDMSDELSTGEEEKYFNAGC